MPVMAGKNENQPESSGDYRSRPRWSAGKKMEAVLRLLRGESLDELSRELKVEFCRHGAAGRGRPPQGARRRAGLEVRRESCNDRDHAAGCLEVRRESCNDRDHAAGCLGVSAP